MSSASMDDLLCQVETDAATKPPAVRAQRLLDLIPPTAYRSAVHALAVRLFETRSRLAIRAGDAHDDRELGFPPPPVPATAALAAERRAGLARKPREVRKIPGTAVVHASPRILAASRAWVDLINTEVPIPGTNTRLQLGDMSVDQLTTVADALYDAHTQVHALAEAIRACEVHTARQLPLETAAKVLEVAA